MTATNSNLGMDELFNKMEGGQIDTEKEYKSFEDRLKKNENEAALIKAIDEGHGAEIIALFGRDALNQKVAMAKSLTLEGKDEKGKKKMKPEVRKAYLVLGELMNKGVSSTGYNSLAENAESNIKWKNTLNKVIRKIDNNKGWTESDKLIAKDAINDLFKDCDSLEEFERRAGTRLATIEAIDNIEDVIKAVPGLVEKIGKSINKNIAEFLEKCGIARDRVIAMFKDAIDAGKATVKDFVEWCKEKGQNIEDISKIILARGGEQFKKFLNYLEGVKENVQDALNAAWEFCGYQWDKFVGMCGGIRDSVADFGAKLVEEGKLAWKIFVESMKNDIAKVTEICKDLLEKGKIAIGEIINWCKSMGQKGSEIIANIIDTSKDLWNKFADWCKENWQSAKDIFKTVAKTLLEKGKMTLDSFVDRCKGARETVKDVACNVLVSLVKAGKFALDTVATALLVAVGSVVLLGEALLKAGKEIYKGAKNCAQFVSDVAGILWEKGKTLFNSIGEFAKSFMKKCKELGLLAGGFITDVCKGIWEKMKSFGLSAADFIKATYETVKGALNNARNRTAEFFMNLGLAAKDIAVTLWEASKSTWTGCVNFVLDHVQNAFQFLKDTCKMSIDYIGKAIMSLKTHVVEFYNYVKQLGIVTFENIKKWCSNSAESIRFFVKTAINKCKATWNDITNRCNGRLQDVKNILIDVYGTTKEGIKNIIKFTGKTALEAGKLLLKLGIGTVAIVIMALKELSCKIYDVSKLCVETLVKAGKLAAASLCQFLSEAYGASKDMIVTIGKYVASAVNNCAKSVRDWIYEKVKDAKKAYEATKEWIKDSIADIAEWLYKRGVEVKQICSIIKNSVNNSLNAAREGIKWFGKKIDMSVASLWEIWTSA